MLTEPMHVYLNTCHGTLYFYDVVLGFMSEFELNRWEAAKLIAQWVEETL